MNIHSHIGRLCGSGHGVCTMCVRVLFTRQFWYLASTVPFVAVSCGSSPDVYFVNSVRRLTIQYNYISLRRHVCLHSVGFNSGAQVLCLFAFRL